GSSRFGLWIACSLLLNQGKYSYLACRYYLCFYFPCRFLRGEIICGSPPARIFSFHEYVWLVLLDLWKEERRRRSPDHYQLRESSDKHLFDFHSRNSLAGISSDYLYRCIPGLLGLYNHNIKLVRYVADGQKEN